MNIDFLQAHRKFLIGGPGDSGWVYPVANPKAPEAGKFLASQQLFSNNGLNVAIYIRNDISPDGIAKSAHATLRLGFTHKKNGVYLLVKDPNQVAMSLDLDGVRHLYTWLQGMAPTLRYEIVRSGLAPKVLSGSGMAACESAGRLRATTTDDTQSFSIDFGLSHGDALALSIYCVAYCKLLYPTISDGVISQMLAIPQSLPKPAACSTTTESASPIKNNSPTETVTNKTRAERQKAIFAVGMNKWPLRHRGVIEHIQETADEATMDRLIKAANRGEFTEWDRIAEYF